MSDPFSYNPVPLEAFKQVKVRYVMKEETPDIAKLAADVLAASEGITPLPWIYDSRVGCAGIYQICDETMPKANCFDDVDRFICFYERKQDDLAEKDWSYLVAACNAAPALARQVQTDAKRIAELEHCPLVHARCGACGVAIHEESGKCGCEDNRLHPIGPLNRDRISAMEMRIAELEAAIRDFLCEHPPCEVSNKWCSAHDAMAKYADNTLCSFGRDLADLRAALERKESAK